MSAAFLYGLVILSAIAHAVWNALMKSAGDRMLTMVAIRVVGLVLGLAALPFVDWPAPASWKWLGAHRRSCSSPTTRCWSAPTASAT